MTMQADVETHFWLTRSVARMLGVSLSDAMARGELTPHGYAQMVARCCAAGCAGRCAEWLACRSIQADAPPSCCAHADQLKALRRA